MSNNVYIHFREICFHDLKYLQVFQPYGTNIIETIKKKIHKEKIIASYYRQLSMDIKMKYIRPGFRPL